MLLLYVATYEASLNSMQQLQELVKTYPKGLLDAIGLSDLSLDTIEKYLNSKHFSLMWPIMAIILAISRGGSQFAGEIQNGTIGLLLSQPVERWRIFAAKYLAGLIAIIVFVVVSTFGSIPLAYAFGFDSHPIILVSAAILLTLFMWSVYSLAVMLSVWANEKGTVYALTGSIMIFMYVVYIVSLLTDSLSGLKYYSLFHYFDTQSVLATGHIGWESYAVFGGLIVATSIAAICRFLQRDVSV